MFCGGPSCICVGHMRQELKRGTFRIVFCTVSFMLAFSLIKSSMHTLYKTDVVAICWQALGQHDKPQMQSFPRPR